MRRWPLGGIGKFFVIPVGDLIKVDVKSPRFTDMFRRFVIPPFVGTHDKLTGVDKNHSWNLRGLFRSSGLGRHHDSSCRNRRARRQETLVRPLIFSQQERVRSFKRTQEFQRRGPLVASRTLGFLVFIGLGLLNIFRQMTGCLTGHLLMQRVLPVLERQSRFGNHYRKKEATPSQTIMYTHSFDISPDLVDNRASSRRTLVASFSKNSIECARRSQKFNLNQEKHGLCRMALGHRRSTPS